MNIIFLVKTSSRLITSILTARGSLVDLSILPPVAVQARTVFSAVYHVVLGLKLFGLPKPTYPTIFIEEHYLFLGDYLLFICSFICS